MKGFVITCSTKNAENALRSAIEANKKSPLAQRMVYRQTYEESIISEHPFVWRMEHRQEKLQKIIPPRSMFPPVKEALEELGAIELIDYSVVFDD